MTWLLDGNVLVAMTLPDHEHFERVHRWLATVQDDPLALSVLWPESTRLVPV